MRAGCRVFVRVSTLADPTPLQRDSRSRTSSGVGGVETKLFVPADVVYLISVVVVFGIRTPRGWWCPAAPWTRATTTAR